MAWWNRLFKKKEPIQQEEDWEQLVYTRNGVNFDEEDQRKRYIVNCLEQIAEASKEIDLLTGEYTLVTSYLTDTDEIEALPAEQREEVNRVAGKLAEELLAAKFLQGIPLAGAVGGGGLGDLAIKYGYHRYQTDVLLLTLVILVLLVQVIQALGNAVAKRIDHRK